MAKKVGLSERRVARQSYKKAVATSRPGEGKRFAALVASVRASGATNPEAVAATIGRGKYGNERFQEMARKGKREKNLRKAR